MTNAFDDPLGFAGEGIPSVVDLGSVEKICFKASSPVEEFVYCKVPRGLKGISETELMGCFARDTRADRFGFDAEDVRIAVATLIQEGWLARSIDGKVLQRLNNSHSICLQWL